MGILYFCQPLDVFGFKEYCVHRPLNKQVLPSKSTSSPAGSEVSRYASSAYLKAPSCSGDSSKNTLLEKVKSSRLHENKEPPCNSKKNSLVKLPPGQSDVITGGLLQKCGVYKVPSKKGASIPNSNNLKEVLPNQIDRQRRVSFGDSLYISRSLSNNNLKAETPGKQGTLSKETSHPTSNSKELLKEACSTSTNNENLQQETGKDKVFQKSASPYVCSDNLALQQSESLSIESNSKDAPTTKTDLENNFKKPSACSLPPRGQMTVTDPSVISRSSSTPPPSQTYTSYTTCEVPSEMRTFSSLASRNNDEQTDFGTTYSSYSLQPSEKRASSVHSSDMPRSSNTLSAGPYSSPEVSEILPRRRTLATSDCNLKAESSSGLVPYRRSNRISPSEEFNEAKNKLTKTCGKCSVGRVLKRKSTPRGLYTCEPGHHIDLVEISRLMAKNKDGGWQQPLLLLVFIILAFLYNTISF